MISCFLHLFSFKFSLWNLASIISVLPSIQLKYPVSLDEFVSWNLVSSQLVIKKFVFF